MSYKIIAHAPTVYQLSSLSLFGMGYDKNPGGSFSAEAEFEDLEDARKFLHSRLDKYRYESDMTEDEYKDRAEDIDKHMVLCLDAVTASIERVGDE